MPRAFLLLAASLALSIVPGAESSDELQDARVDRNSPDGRFAIRSGIVDSGLVFEIVDARSGEPIGTIADSRKGNPKEGYRYLGEIEWAPNSERLAVAMQVVKHSAQIALFQREGSSFRPVKLPQLSDPFIPARYAHLQAKPGGDYGYWTPERWTEEGALIVRGVTDFETSTLKISATRIVTLSPNRAGVWRIVDSSRKFTVRTLSKSK